MTRKHTFFRILLYIPLLSCFPGSIMAQVNFDDNLSAAQLVDYLVGNNVTYTNPVLNCPVYMSGKFQVVTSNLPVGEGIVLATGPIKTQNNYTGLDGPVDLFNSDEYIGGPGDPNLSALLYNGIGGITQDACVLEFDFVPDITHTSTLHFNYSFGSEEYNEYTCSEYNDIFAFLLSGPGVGTNVNIALVPGTNIPVAINSINNGTPGIFGIMPNCTGMGPGSPYTQYFINNELLNGQTVTLDGFTTKLEALATVQPCETYHIKLAIADVTDAIFNSAVFLERNSFRIDSSSISLDNIITTGLDYVAEGCVNAQITGTRPTPSSYPKKLCLSYGGTAINGIDYPLLPDSLVIPAGGTTASMTILPIQDFITEAGFETVVVRRLNCCTGQVLDSVIVKIRDSLEMKLLSTDVNICGQDSVTLHVTGEPGFTYSWSPAAIIFNPTDTFTRAWVTTTTQFQVTASFPGCPDMIRSFTAKVEPIPQVDVMPDTALCLKEPLKMRADVSPDFNAYSFSWMPATGLDDPSAQQPLFYSSDTGTFRYTLKVQTPLGCTGSDSFSITTFPGVTLTNVTPDQIVKYGSTIQLNADGAEFYTWVPDNYLDYPNTKNPRATPTDSVTLMLVGLNRIGCKDTAYVTLNVDYTMLEIVPDAFSPNGDGLNDVFRITNLNFQKLQEFRIFNRWGQEVFHTNNPETGWDGRFKGVPQDLGTYQYLIRVGIPDGKSRTYKGSVTLLR